MNDFTILHLSDLHISDTLGRPDILFDNLLKDIKSEMQFSDNILIVVTGDLVDKANYENADKAVAFFERLHNILGGKVKHIYIVPGNHDKIRSKLDSIIIGYYNKKQKDDASKEDMTDDIQTWRYIRTSFEEHVKLVKSIYEIFYNKKLVPERLFGDTYGAHIDTVNGKNICFLQFNTAWKCQGTQDQRNLCIGEFQMEGIKKVILLHMKI